MKEKGSEATTPWWNDDLEKAVMKKKEAYSKWLCTKTVQDRNIYKNARRRVQEDIKTSNNLFWEKTTEQINTCACNTTANKAEFIVVGDEDGVDLDVEKYKLRNVESFKYLGVTFSKNGKVIYIFPTK
ncbi:hypothetical protein HHI36_010199 [Cryptolaemus montrouzieri]|uniref:Uncharacterized protein n=1 Tax=Cryptolaemus montrouzieri TaxID=559131 RepID=A0ABD2MI58_9CUCU